MPLGLLGSATGAAAGLGLVAAAGGRPGPVIAAALAAAAGGVMFSLAALTVPLRLLARRLPATALAGE